MAYDVDLISNCGLFAIGYCYVMFSCSMIKNRRGHSNKNAHSRISSSGSPHLGSRFCAEGV